jgi:hypothetical protein
MIEFDFTQHGIYQEAWTVPFYAVGSLLVAYGTALLFASLFVKDSDIDLDLTNEDIGG